MIDFKNCPKRIINLDSRFDRRLKILSEFERLGLTNYKVFSAIDGNSEQIKSDCSKGALGCRLSHLRVIQKAKEEYLQYVAIIEDDCEFEDDFLIKCKEYLSEIPNTWDMIYLGGQHKQKFSRFGKYAVFPSYLCSTHCYIINSTAYDKIIELLQTIDKPIDVIYAEKVQNTMDVFAPWPNLAVQRPGYSDVEGIEVDYRPFMKTVLNV